jgi:hypothetical protein
MSSFAARSTDTSYASRVAHNGVSYTKPVKYPSRFPIKILRIVVRLFYLSVYAACHANVSLDFIIIVIIIIIIIITTKGTVIK